MLKMLIQFILSGFIVCSSSYLAPRFGQKWAGLIVAAPLLTLLTFIFLSLNASTGDLHEYLKSALVFMVPAAIFIASLWVFSSRTYFVVNILISFCVFGVAVLCIHKLHVV